MITASSHRAQPVARVNSACPEATDARHGETARAARSEDRATSRVAGDDIAPRWQDLWRRCVTDPVELLSLLGLSSQAATLLGPDPIDFPLRVPRGFVARMRHGDARDPLLLQVLPLAAELAATPGFSRDAVGDLAARVTPGLLHKYHGRALLLATGACAVHCRYCFRRHFPYAQETAATRGWLPAVAQLRADESISEVILSGGDPLALTTPKLAELTDQLADIAHLRRLRIHTRLPIVLPERIDEELMAWLRLLPWPTTVVVHANHPNELDAGVAAACARLRACAVVVLNQSVLLRGINDNASTLAALSERLFECGVLPYYLHQLDRISGAAHFEVSDANARALIGDIQRMLPGYLVPRLVREIPGEAGKTLL
jgi:EF-P beta-lysylation protein EpmB